MGSPFVSADKTKPPQRRLIDKVLQYVRYSECQQRCETGCSLPNIRGGDDMVTYSDLFQFGILICAIIGLCLLS